VQNAVALWEESEITLVNFYMEMAISSALFVDKHSFSCYA
jgi:hypothetical protein